MYCCKTAVTIGSLPPSVVNSSALYFATFVMPEIKSVHRLSLIV